MTVCKVILLVHSVAQEIALRKLNQATKYLDQKIPLT
jgi:hypothetical protein